MTDSHKNSLNSLNSFDSYQCPKCGKFTTTEIFTLPANPLKDSCYTSIHQCYDCPFLFLILWRPA